MIDLSTLISMLADGASAAGGIFKGIKTGFNMIKSPFAYFFNGLFLDKSKYQRVTIAPHSSKSSAWISPT